MRIMISQPMTGKTTEEIRKEREELVKQLESQGHEVMDTVFNFEGKDPYNHGLFYMGHSVLAMSEVDAVVFMPGWQYSRGCKIEHELALRYGLFIKEI